MWRPSSLAWPIALAVVLLTLTVGLLVIWIIGQVSVQQWGLLTVGTVFLMLIVLGVVAYLVITIKEIALTKRQANFIDAVTHELKSPIASIKLCLQTLEMRDVSPEQVREFHRFMLEDVQRLDGLIDHLLAVARLGVSKPLEPEEDVLLPPLLTRCVEDVVRRYELPADAIRMELEPCVVRARVRELEMVFTNLLDNAVKYGGSVPQVVVQAVMSDGNKVTVRVSDNGRGVRFELRAKIFQRFFRGGAELERTTKGIGLGLHIVYTLVRRMRGKVSVHGRGPLRGATFEVTLPAAAEVPVRLTSAPMT